ncbi:MAG: hypothetical protein RL124_757 [Acidobacteriota bacterium]|jgi:hypothetical protein
MKRLFYRLLLGLLPFTLWAQTSNPVWFKTPLAPRLANYEIEAYVNPVEHALKGSLKLTWKNAGTEATDKLPLHLYLNAFKGPNSIFMQEGSGKLRGDRMGDDSFESSWGYCRLLSVTSEGRKLSGSYGEDESVYWINLMQAVAPGETLTLEIQWESQFPRVFARTGWSDGFLMAAQWFPKVGVYQGSQWTSDAHHADTEFFSDFGTYAVNVNVPRGFWLAHSGEAISYIDPVDGLKKDAWPDPADDKRMIYKLYAEDIHDFAFAMKSNLDWKRRDFSYRGVKVSLFYEPSHHLMIDRHVAAIEASLRLTEEWYFKYPYPVLTVVDPPENASGADGMEYPTMIMAGTNAFDPLKFRIPEVVTVHEFGHQYFYGMLASNEVDEPWLDEGFTSYFESKAMQRHYSGLFNSRRFQLPGNFQSLTSYLMTPNSDPLTRKGYESATYGNTAYTKPDMVLQQLEALLGHTTMSNVVTTYAREMAFKHPTHLDFKRIAERISGRNLDIFWSDYIMGTGTLDYQIERVSVLSVREGGWNINREGDASFESIRELLPQGRIKLERRGDIVSPITLWVKLSTGEERKVRWDGKDRWVHFDFPAPIVQAQLDPDYEYPILRDRLYASWSPKAPTRGIAYWAHLVTTFLTYCLQGIGLL